MFVIALTTVPLSGQQLTFTPFNSTGIYQLNESAGWTVTLPAGVPAPAKPYSYVIKTNNLEIIKSGDLDLTSGKTAIEITLDRPAMLYAEITPPEGGRPYALGAAVAPDKLEPVVPRPADFDDFWKAKLRALRDVSPNPVLTPGDSGNPHVDYATIQMDHVAGHHVQGQLAVPKQPGKHPALLILQWASPPYPLQKPWVVDRAAQGWLCLNIEPHDVPPNESPGYYAALPDELKRYESIGNDDRDRSYFVQMYLADVRAVDYLASRPDWDGQTLVVTGTSMGGQQSLCVAGLHPKITHVIVNEPAGCDTNAPLHGRQIGYPFFPATNPKVMETALYVDAVNFASRIKAPALVAMGFVDTIAPPAGIWTALNQIPGPKEAVPMVDSPHNNLASPEQQRPYTQRSEQWLNSLVKTGALPTAADQPIPRTDANSRLAHQQLLAKARQGRIDVYFLGDSITRRWGATDPQYKTFLENWNQNFFGWNAANFGWGGDTTQNILWRIQNGELDGVNPKVIVLLAGTNNIGNQPPADADAASVEHRAAEVARGVKDIIELCRQKAPDAVIILTAIFPRNDNIAVMPTINKTNELLAKLADGKQIRFLNVNDKLADSSGKLFDGMMGDGLHPAIKGYQVWADALKSILSELLGPPAKEDHAPPPTGDPSVR